MRVTVLGSGTSTGVPVIGCTCKTCSSPDIRDTRTRTSLWIRTDTESVVIDTSSDFRQQCLLWNVDSLTAVLYTHHHFDHISGFDDLRAFNYIQKKSIPVYLTEETCNEMERIFAYAFTKDEMNLSSKPLIDIVLIDSDQFVIGDLTIIPLDLVHGNMNVKGFKIGKFAYCTDCNVIPDYTLDLMQDLDVLILDGLRKNEHPTHMTFDKAVETAIKVGARQTYLTHIAHDYTHEEIQEMLPPNIHPAHDGLVIELKN